MERVLFFIGKLVGNVLGMLLRAIFFLLVGLVGKAVASYKQSHAKPLELTPETRFEHTHIVAGSGHGKTQLLQQVILDDLELVKEGNASVVVIDSQGDMIRKIMHLADMKMLSERNQLLLIDPNDIEHPPALNLFDFGLERLQGYSAVEREKLVNGAISLYEYLFGGLLGAQLTQRQGVIFRYLARLLMVVPGATVHTLMDFLEEPAKVTPYLPRLDGMSRRFFTTQWHDPSFVETRQQILTRLWGVLSNNVLERMLANERNKVDLFSAMNNGSLILINTAKDLLKQEGCEIFGRFFIALICQAAQERAAIPEDRRRTTFVYIDEAHDYFDESMENLLNQARKYKVGLILAHQNLDQFDNRLLATVMASTSVKIVGGLSSKDAAVFAKEMRIPAEHFQEFRKTDKETTFAVFVRNRMQEPAALRIPLGLMEGRPRLSDAEFEEVLTANRLRVAGGVAELAPPEGLKALDLASAVSRQEML